ncbi:MAG: phage baseplate assembly protein V [Myxococcota bacterium]
MPSFVGGRGQAVASGGNNQQITIGIVTDNVDPDELGRIELKFPILGDAKSHWIRLGTPMAGEKRGFYALPEKDDEVLVAFMQGDIRTGVIVGQLWNKVDLPPTEAKDGLPGPSKTDTGASWSTEVFTDGSKTLEKNDRRFWRSRSGHLFVFDDSEGKETVQVWDKEHNLSVVLDSVKKLITIANTQGDLHIRTKQDLYFEAGRDIKIKAGQNLKGETGQTIDWKAGTSFKHESGTDSTMKSGTGFSITGGSELKGTSPSTTMEGTGKMTVTGGMTEVKGTSMVNVSGGMIKLN